MENSLKIRTLQALNIVAFLVMAGFNALAEILPINDKTTRQLSDQYPNLFTPAGFTFSIWSVIYLLLLAFTIFQASGFFSKKVSPTVAALHKAVGLDFVLTSFLNASWIIVWHFEWVALSVVIMLIMLYLLVNTLLNVTNMSKEIKTSERFLIRASFGLYTGWISMAAIANITVFLVWAGWDGFGLSPEFWTAAMIGTGTIITLFMLSKQKMHIMV
ncbi:hypothetical protein ACFFJX_26100 [Pseudarcicella hirudinis]|uniref:hypothetical protein n=1 Tax=Pseudarcicella hirudinis TaxID=1079859 RepID=UPI0035EFABB9